MKESEIRPLLRSESEDAVAQQERRRAFALRVLPFMLKSTTGHPIVPVNFSTRRGVLPLKRNFKGQPVVLRTARDINDWMTNSGRFTKCGGACFTRGFMSLFWEPNPEVPIRIAIYDIDVGPEGLKAEPRARKFAFRLARDIRKKWPQMVVLVFFTGSGGYHVWMRHKDWRPLGSYVRVRDKCVLPVARKIGLHIPRGKYG